jgi:hypothetical protein
VPLPQEHPEPENQKKKRTTYHGIWEARSPRKEAHQPHVWFPTQIPQRTASKTFPRKSTKKILQITEKEIGKYKIHKQIKRGQKNALPTFDTGKIL